MSLWKNAIMTTVLKETGLASRAAYPPGLAFNLSEKRQPAHSGTFTNRHAFGFVWKIRLIEKRGRQNALRRTKIPCF